MGLEVVNGFPTAGLEQQTMPSQSGIIRQHGLCIHCASIAHVAEWLHDLRAPTPSHTLHEGNDNAEAQYETGLESEEFVLTIVAMDRICVQHHVVSNRR